VIARAVASPTAAAFGEYFFHAVVGRVWFTFFDADSSEQAQRVRVHRVDWFILYDAIDELEQRIIAGADGVERLARDVDEFHRWWIGGLTERIDP
jgi:hypothetical protein